VTGVQTCALPISKIIYVFLTLLRIEARRHISYDNFDICLYNELQLAHANIILL
jgi:hypothetical protein